MVTGITLISSGWWNKLPRTTTIRLFSAVLTVLLLSVSACTTTGPTHQTSEQKALEDHIRLGLSYVREGNRQMARDHIERALKIDKRSPGANHAMALLLQMELENDLAEDYYKKSIAYDRGFTWARYNYGVFLFRQGRYEDAYDQFKKGSEDIGYRNRHQVYYSLGIVAYHLGKEEEAQEAWKKAIVLSPQFAMPHLELAEYHFYHGDLKMARKHLEAFDTLSQPQARSLWLAVRIEDQSGNKDAVASKGLALVKLFPESEETRLYRAWLKDETRN